MTKLRNYQQKALDLLLWDRSIEGNSLVVLPQGSGKSHIIAAYSKAINSPTIIFQPTREVLKQNYSKLLPFVKKEEIGIYSASLKQKDKRFYTFATIQSVYKHPEDFKEFRTVIVDEADLLNPRKENMYTDFIHAIDIQKVVGFTGTPFRMATRTRSWGNNFWQKEVYSVTELINRVYPPFWKRLLYSVDMQTLIDQGHLVPIKYVDLTIKEHKDIPLNKSRSEFDLAKYWEDIKSYDKAGQINKLASSFTSVLVFCSTVDEAESLERQCFLDRKTAVVSYRTPAKERAKIIEEFKNGTIYAVFNVQALTVGFDHPQLDCIILNRPTRSLRLYNQIVGRGSRPYPGKTHCTLIDFSGTVKALGRLETFKVEKQDNHWEIVSEKGSWHNRELYSYKLPS